MIIDVAAATSFCAKALEKAGLSSADAQVAAEVLVTTDTWGVFTHGMKNLRGYIRRLRGGGLRSHGRPAVEAGGLAWARVNGDSSLAMVTSAFAMNAAIERAKQAGIGFVTVRNSCHFGAAGMYAWMAARDGFIGIAMSNDTPTVTVPGGRGPVLGSNPFAFAAPNGPAPPFLLDMATSTVAGGKVFAAAAAGKAVPESWIVDAEGLPTTNPNAFPHEGALTPMAGHKGYGLALMIETLSGVLSGSALAGQILSWSFAEAACATDHGAAFIAINIEAFMQRVEFETRLQGLLEKIRSAPKARGVDRIYVPGEMEWERRAIALERGIVYPEAVWAEMEALARELELPLPGIRS
jgi:LDH2 family malate/lactate/ureidoglycolate dehydrogenase